jgi:molybdopterin/thiamine biosynthesis adenylyltransferase
MSPSVALSFPDAPVHSLLPWSNHSLRELILSQMRAADPYGRFHVRPAESTDYKMPFGPKGQGMVIHGSGWNAYIGPGASPLPEAKDYNPTGPGLAAVLAVSRLFVHNFNPPDETITANALTWDARVVPDGPALPMDNLGDICVAGVGSVGTAALYFLALSNRPFHPTLIDMDRVKRWNLDRSAIFGEADVGRLKVEVARDFLADTGFMNIRTEGCPLHEANTWNQRGPGSPDILIAAANELNVRYHIEAQYPPLQIYGTTGRNWQISLIRHIPLIEACSCCLFSDNAPRTTTTCASAPYEAEDADDKNADVALPFLSFGAGLMAAAEVLKTAVSGYPFNRNRMTLTMRPTPRLVASRIAFRPGCICSDRRQSIHRKMLEGGRHAYLSTTPANG